MGRISLMSFPISGQKGLVYPGTHSFHVPSSIAANFLNPGTSDFAVEALIYPSSSMGYTGYAKPIFTKSGNSIITPNACWGLFYNVGSELVTFHICDGSAYTSMNSDADSVPLNSWSWIRVEIDRDVNCIIYGNGEQIGSSTNFLTTQGSISNSESINSGNYPGTYAEYYFEGVVAMLRYNSGTGTVLGPNFVSDEWARIACGLPRGPLYVNSSYAWMLDETLSCPPGLTPLTFDVWDTGTPTWTYGFPLYTTNTNYSPSPGIEHGYVPLNTPIRTMDGTAQIYQGPAKRRWSTRFVTTEYSWVCSVMALQFDALGIYLYPQWWGTSSGAAVPVILTAPPVVREIKRNETTGESVWEVELQLEEE